MKYLILVISVLFFASCVRLSNDEQYFLEVFANRTDGLGIGFDEQQTFDYQLRQKILKSDDENIQRAFILTKLPRYLDWILIDLEKGQRMIGKGIYKKLSKSDQDALIKKFKRGMNLYKKLDKNGHEHFYEKREKRLKSALKPEA